MSTINVFDAYGERGLTAEDEAEIHRLTELYKELQREDAQLRVRQLAREMMALSTRLDGEERETYPLDRTVSSEASLVLHFAEQIRRTVTAPESPAAPQ